MTVLPPDVRMTRREDFVAALRRGRRAAADGIVVHASVPDGASTTSPGAPSVGFVVSRAVGPAVTRNLVRRRLRHILAARRASLPAGARVVVRATPAAAGRSSAELADSIDRALGRLYPGPGR